MTTQAPTQFTLSLQVLLLVISFLVIAPLAIGMGILFNQSWIFGCGARGYDGNKFLAYCAAKRFADYEHAAYWRNLEPEAINALRHADVVVLGNSRAQFAFSTQPVLTYFKQNSLKLHLLSMGYGEAAPFPRMLIEKYDIRPRAAIINMDYFFDEDMSAIAAEAMKNDWKMNLSFALKQKLQTIHPKICANVPWMCGHDRAIFRDRTLGTWHLQDYAHDKAAPLPAASAALSPKDRTLLLHKAREYISWLSSRGTCVIITGVPSPRYDREVSREIAQSLNRPTVYPQITGLEYFDGSHLAQKSADRYAQAMLPELRAALTACGL